MLKENKPQQPSFWAERKLCLSKEGTGLLASSFLGVLCAPGRPCVTVLHDCVKKTPYQRSREIPSFFFSLPQTICVS